ncbi:MAG TPA: FtsX-like permease family protein, partial [Polyangiales bacterium]
MFKSYLKVALRRLSREKFYVSMNILSLALGIASFLVLALYLRSELTYDQHNVNYKSIYRVTAHFNQAGQEEKHFAISQMGIAPMLAQDYPQLGTYVRFVPPPVGEIRYGDTRKVWDNTFLADPSVFKVFTHEIRYGDPAHAFDEPTSIAIDETMSKFYFGNENPIGKQLITTSGPMKVTLVFADLPENSHLRYDALFPIDQLKRFNPNFGQNYQQTLWNIGNFSYLMVTPQFRPEEFPSLSASFYQNHMKEQGEKMKSSFQAQLQPLAEQHFGEKLDADRLEGNVFYLYGFGAVAIFILAIGCINYVNLATARAAKQAKEVGMRKVLGANQAQLVSQFLGESLTFTAIALVLALVLMELALAFTPVGRLMGKEHLLSALREPSVWLGVVAVTVVVAIASGLYPALYLSNITPLAALTETRKSWKKGFSLRQILVFAQLAISIGVVASTMLMANQMRYIHNLPLGFDKENRLILNNLTGLDVLKNLKTIKTELRRTPGVLDV